jgi:hypothetical protein
MEVFVKEHPIIFSTPMVQAIITGQKTMTRRIIRKPERYSNIRDCAFCCLYGEKGDRLWAKETWKRDLISGGIIYRADSEEMYLKYKGFWKTSIYMPRTVSRITLEITSVRVERLQEITREDAISEGIEKMGTVWYKDYRNPAYTLAPKESYQTLWESINGKGSWESNPWVWVIEFKEI